MKHTSENQFESLLSRGYSRRHIGRILSAITTGTAALPFTGFAQAQEAERRMRGGNRSMMDPTIVRISSSENPRYSPTGEQQDFVSTVTRFSALPARSLHPVAAGRQANPDMAAVRHSSSVRRP